MQVKNLTIFSQESSLLKPIALINIRNLFTMYLGFPCHSKNVRLNYEEQIVMQSIC